MSEDFNIEELLKEHLLDAQEVPPGGIFDKIEARVLNPEKRKNRFLFWIWFGLGLGAIITTLGIGANSFFGSKSFVSQAKQRNDDNSDLNAHQLDTLLVLINGETQYNANSSEKAILKTDSNGVEQNATPYSNQKEMKGFKPNKTLNRKTNDIKTNSENITATNSTQTNTKHQNNPKKGSNLSKLTRAENKENAIEDSTNMKYKHENTTNAEILTNLVNPTDSVFAKTESDTLNQAQKEVEAPDSIATLSLDPPAEDTKKSNYGLVIYGGPALFDIAVFKPYFSSGALSNRTFPSSSYEIGLGFYYTIKEKFNLSFIGNYNTLQSEFKYDLMISENDFFNLYENGKVIPIENLDNPETCNCFLAEDAALSYKINRISLAFSASYDLISRPKFTFGPNVSFSSVLSSKFSNKSSSIIEFSVEQKEKFIGTNFQIGFGFDYRITNRFSVGLAPSYGIQFAKKSSIYAQNLTQILIPITLKIALN